MGSEATDGMVLQGLERSRTFRRRVDAEKFLAHVEVAKLRGEWIDPRLGRMRLREHWERLEPMLAARVRPSTIGLYRGLWSAYLEPELGARPIAALTRLELEEFVGKMSAAGAGPATVGATVRLLHRILQAAVDSRLIVGNPAHRLGRPALPQTEMRFLTPEEVERLVDCTPDEWKAFVMLAAWCGLRFGEIAGLKVERVDFLRRRLRIERRSRRSRGICTWARPRPRPSDLWPRRCS